ncbi:transcriptional regulator [Lentzea sp. NBRC 105346]|uniref:helix-turn-helix domain-containing protein n=1 Tax=Lentzea sp. NBRC 105346 TaxID=3032205 RepID=UPI0024A5621D|nr:helix-turn-helix transcriptional regulator [Lentzea sp. NBRC 105346]GLZ28947.1 transcriptional regulator [Lentzea sp. NBRC 105346]
MLDPAQIDFDRADLSKILRHLRKAARLSGERLAARTHMSQSKISRIENGRLLPSITDVQQILRALEVPQDQARELLELAKVANTEYESRRDGRQRGATRWQRELTGLVEQSSHIRYVLPVMPPGMLQTREYVVSNVYSPLSKYGDNEKARLVEAKLARHELLHLPGKTFTFLFTETAVRNRLLPPAGMADQVDHLVAASHLPSVRIEVLPLDVVLSRLPLNIFMVYDERLVLVETHGGATVLRDPADVAEHLELFEYFQQHTLKGDECREFLRGIADEFRAES